MKQNSRFFSRARFSMMLDVATPSITCVHGCWICSACFCSLLICKSWQHEWWRKCLEKKKLHLQGSLRSSHDNSFVKQSASSSPWWSCGFATSVELKQFRVGYYMVGFVESFIWLGAAGEQLSPRCLRCALNIRCSQKCWETHRRKWQDKQNKYISPAVSLAGPLWIIYPGWWMFRMFGCLESQL